MHGFIQSEALHIRKVDAGRTRAEHLLGVVVGFKSHVFRFGRRLHLIQQRSQGETDPRYDNGPSVGAAVPVDALFKWGDLEQAVQVERLGFGYLAVYLQRPRRGAEILRVFGGIFFVGAELIIIVVVRNDFERGWLLAVGIVRRLLGVGQLHAAPRGSPERAKSAQ